jgi:hypothetical protein
LSAGAKPSTLAHVPAPRPAPGRGPILDAALRLLADGRPHSAHELLAAGIARGDFPADTRAASVETALRNYLQRKAQSGRRAPIVREPDRRYRLNRPPDPWPDPQSPLAFRPPSPATLASLETVRTTAVGDDPTAFERAVCDFFATLGFTATHLGGNVRPDGYIDAPLGVLGYRVVLECKTAATYGHVSVPTASEPAHYRDAYGAQACALIGAAFWEGNALASELAIHGVSAWTLDDLTTLAHAGLDPHEMRPLFAPGFAEDALGELLWERAHGAAKRIAVITEMLQHVGSREQRLTARPADAPRLTVDAAILCVNEALADANSDARAQRADVEAAFTWMTHPLVRTAVWADASHNDIVVVALDAPAQTEIDRAPS